MNNTYILFDDPAAYPAKAPFPDEGSSPKFTRFLIEFLSSNKSGIESIHLAFYLFNNFKLHQLFIELAKEGIPVEVVSIPLEGYDNKSPQQILTSEGQPYLRNKHTKYSLASLVYRNFTEKPHPGYRLYCFPHTYIRSSYVKPFSRGTFPYSLHTKFLVVRMKNGSVYGGITSSNLALRDQVKHDFLVLKKLKNYDAHSAISFFSHLKESSLPASDAIRMSGNLSWNPVLKNQARGESFFSMAPFYPKSPEIIEEMIINLINNARERIWIMAQHISAYQFTVDINSDPDRPVRKIRRKGILSSVIDKGMQGVRIKCISQTYASPEGSDLQFRKPVNQMNFINFIRELRKVPDAYFAVNENVHSKYFIIDDLVIASTFNYTPTQFIYLPEVKISQFKYMKGLSYTGIFSEVGNMMILKSKDELKCFEKNFMFVWNAPETLIPHD